MTHAEMIRDLEAKRDAMQRAIDALRGLDQGSLSLKSRRGRKSMGAEERAIVSDRMRKYWARMRKAKGAA